MDDSDTGTGASVGSSEPLCKSSMETTSEDVPLPIRPARRSLVHFDTKDSVYEAFATSLDEPTRMLRSHSDSELASHPIEIEFREEEDVKKHFVAYVGLLREGFVYSVKVRLPPEHTDTLLPVHHRTQVLEDPKLLKSISTDIETTEEEGTGIVVQCTIFLKQGIYGTFTDKVTFTGDNSTKDKLFRLTLNAQVLRAEQGKPSLRDGVKCLGLSPVDTSMESGSESETNEGDNEMN